MGKRKKQKPRKGLDDQRNERLSFRATVIAAIIGGIAGFLGSSAGAFIQGKYSIEAQEGAAREARDLKELEFDTELFMKIVEAEDPEKRGFWLAVTRNVLGEPGSSMRRALDSLAVDPAVRDIYLRQVKSLELLTYVLAVSESDWARNHSLRRYLDSYAVPDTLSGKEVAKIRVLQHNEALRRIFRKLPLRRVDSLILKTGVPIRRDWARMVYPAVMVHHDSLAAHFGDSFPDYSYVHPQTGVSTSKMFPADSGAVVPY